MNEKDMYGGAAVDVGGLRTRRSDEDLKSDRIIDLLLRAHAQYTHTCTTSNMIVCFQRSNFSHFSSDRG